MHKILYNVDGMYGSHPANHGRWDFGDKWMFGILTGQRGEGQYHDILPPYTKVLFESYDYGKSWSAFVPNVDFECRELLTSKPIIGPEAVFRVCGSYDTGGEEAVDCGGFYVSHDKGKSWSGAYEFTGVNSLFTRQFINTSRTCQLDNRLFVSSRFKKRWGSDSVYCIEHNGSDWSMVCTVCDDKGRAVMPSVCRATEDIVFCALRRKGVNYNNSIQIFKSIDNCKTWTSDEIKHNFYTGEKNGNPPALTMIDNILYCCFCNRTRRELCYVMSIDFGRTWDHVVIDKHVGDDIGYPVMFGNSTTGPICIYYSDGKIWQRNF